jgi:predicted RNase H-like HicB family nuclease
MATVVGLIHGQDKTFGISFPDFPGLASGGTSISDAVERGREGLAVHVEALGEERLPLPHLRSIDEVIADPDLAEDLADAVAMVIVDVDLPGRSVRLNVSLDERLVQRIDRRAAELGETRSGFLAAAARARLAG